MLELMLLKIIFARCIVSEQIILLRDFEKGVESNHAAHISASIEFQIFWI